MLLNEAVLQETAEKGNEEKGIAPIFIEHRPDIIPYRFLRPHELFHSLTYDATI
jgi:hypothetical protein